MNKQQQIDAAAMLYSAHKFGVGEWDEGKIYAVKKLIGDDPELRKKIAGRIWMLRRALRREP